MSERLNWMLPSFELPRLGSIRVRFSAYFLVLLPVLGIRFGWSLGSAVFLILCLSTFLHGLGHLLLARATGGLAHEINIAPLGSMAPVQFGQGVWSQFVTAIAGPFVHIVICLICFPSYYAPDSLWGALNPTRFPVSELHWESLMHDLGLAVFGVNLFLFVVNLLPILPLDGGVLFRIFLSRSRLHPELVDQRAIQFSLLASGILAFIGLSADLSLVAFVGGLLFIPNLLVLTDDDDIERDDDSFLGYDFSEGYTSLDRSAPTPGTAQTDSQRGLISGWRERRRIQRELELRRQQEEAERQLDELLAKVHEQGMNSLTKQEQRALRQVSELLRDRGKKSS